MFTRLFPKKALRALLQTSRTNPLHLRPAAAFAQEAKRFSCDVTIRYKAKTADAKSIQEILSLGIPPKERFELICKGKDAAKALRHLTEHFQALMAAEQPRTHPTSKTHVTYQARATAVTPIGSGIVVAPLYPLTQRRYRNDSAGSFQEAVKKALDAFPKGEIYDAQRQLLQSLASHCDNMETFIAAIREGIRNVSGALENKQDDYKDILKRVEEAMGISYRFVPPPEEAIVAIQALLPSEVEAILALRNVKGILLQRCHPDSHTAILLRQARLPVASIEDLPKCTDALNAILDCDGSVLVTRPTEDDIRKARQRASEKNDSIALADKRRFEPVTLKNGERVSILANVTDLASAKEAKAAGAEGIGLLRSEFLFQTKHPPSLETQIETYRAIFELFEDVTVRTLDIGGDKPLDYLALPQEKNPFLGVRGIRVLSLAPELFETQLLAIYKASQGKKIKVMFPMIDTPETFDKAKRFAIEVARKHQTDISRIAFGMMLEVPLALFALDEFDKTVDFYSVGSNDLAQYLFAIERTHPTLFADTSHRAFVRALESIADRVTKPLSLCGEIASDAKLAKKLVEAGYRTLSLSAAHISRIKEELRRV